MLWGLEGKHQCSLNKGQEGAFGQSWGSATLLSFAPTASQHGEAGHRSRGQDASDRKDLPRPRIDSIARTESHACGEQHLAFSPALRNGNRDPLAVRDAQQAFLRATDHGISTFDPAQPGHLGMRRASLPKSQAGTIIRPVPAIE